LDYLFIAALVVEVMLFVVDNVSIVKRRLEMCRSKRWVLEYVPTEPTPAIKILEALIKAGRKWKFSYKGTRSDKKSLNGQTKSLARYLDTLPEVKFKKEGWVNRKLYYKEV
jgi:hypothetical protein